MMKELHVSVIFRSSFPLFMLQTAILEISLYSALLSQSRLWF